MSPASAGRALRRTCISTLVVVALALAVTAVPAAAATTTTPAKAAGATKAAKAATKATPTGTGLSDKPAHPDSFESQKLNLPSSTAKSKKSSGKGGSGSGSSAGTIGRMILGLLFVLALIYAVHWLLKHYGKSKLGATGSGASGASGAIEVLATTPLAAGRMLHLVRIGNQTILLGATDANITQLGTVDTLEMAYAAGNAGNAEFQQLLNGAIGSTGPGGNAQQDTFLRRFVANLQLMTAR